MDGFKRILKSLEGEDCEFYESGLYQFIVNSLPIAVIVLNAELEIIEFNPRAEKITGYPREKAIGRTCGEILKGERCDNDCPLKNVVFPQKTTVQFDTTLYNKYKEEIPVRMIIAGLFDEKDRLIGGVGVFQDISDIKALEREKANLISMFAHDMRSSLAGIHGLGLRLLNKSDDITEQKQRQYLKIINKEASKLETLIDDFLEFSRMQTGKLTFCFSATSLDKELMELFETYQFKALQHRVGLELRIGEALPIVEADVERLHRVFTNLLDNALKFSKENGKVIVEAGETNQEIMIKIIDEGTGISPAELPYVFDLFYRSSSTGKREGYGIGLATVKAIVEGHGGRIHVASELGKGTVFTVFLPKQRKEANDPTLKRGLRGRCIP